MKRFDFSKNEIKDLIITFIVLSVAFSILGSEEFNQIPYTLQITMIGVGLGFLLREIAIKMTATHFNYWAEFKTTPIGLFIALITSFGGFVYSVTGSVYVYGDATDKQNGLICMSGIASNILLAIIFFGFYLLIKMYGIEIQGLYSGLLLDICKTGLFINGSIAFFNSLPFTNIDGSTMDGSAVFKWNPIIWFVLVSFSLYIFWLGATTLLMTKSF